MEDPQTYACFVGQRLIATGPLGAILTRVKEEFERDRGTPFLIFEDHTGRQVDFDLRGSLEEVLARAQPSAVKPGPGRPKLGVVSREVTLLPRHWEWLEAQPSGASAAIRRLIEDARKREPEAQRLRTGREALGRFLSAMAGNLPGYEEASRALYEGDRERFGGLIRDWPVDIRAHVERLSERAFAVEPALPVG
jgi:uncharacterized protein